MVLPIFQGQISDQVISPVFVLQGADDHLPGGCGQDFGGTLHRDSFLQDAELPLCGGAIILPPNHPDMSDG